MKIWHFGAAGSLAKICGVTTTVWLIAKEQAKLGYEICLMVDEKPDLKSQALAEENGFKLIYIPGNKWRYNSEILTRELKNGLPEVVHLHSVFIPKQATLAMTLKKRGIPYIITPHGGLNFRRSRLKKIIYSWLIEKRRFSNSAAITVLMPPEEEEVKAFVSSYKGIVRWIVNPIDANTLELGSWQGNLDKKTLVYLGRFDVIHKGIDILVEIARAVPEVKFNLYGSEEAKSKALLEKLKQNTPSNVEFHNPIFDKQKVKTLAEASLYIQTSRWEGFSISIAEALHIGLPCAISDRLNIAEIFRQHELGILLPSEPKAAATILKDFLERPEKLQELSKKGVNFAHTYLQPQAVALAYLKLYEEVIS